MLSVIDVEKRFTGYGYNAIQTEEYRQWIIEDKFASDFPDLTQVGVVITKDIEPYEETKIRILNGGHTSLGLSWGSLRDMKLLTKS
jgi:D-arabinitol 4-dehydrogenase